MPWARLDDTFHSHPKTYIAGLDGCGLWAKALSYSAQHLTDGFLPEGWVMAQVPATSRHADRQGIIERLIEAGMFEEAPGGYRVHDYLVCNPSREDIENDRKAAAERMSKRRGGSREVPANGSGSSATPDPYPDPSPSQSEPPLPPVGGRKRDRDAFAKAFTAWSGHHFPNAEVNHVKALAAWVRERCTQPVTADLMREWARKQAQWAPGILDEGGEAAAA